MHEKSCTSLPAANRLRDTCYQPNSPTSAEQNGSPITDEATRRRPHHSSQSAFACATARRRIPGRPGGARQPAGSLRMSSPSIALRIASTSTPSDANTLAAPLIVSHRRQEITETELRPTVTDGAAARSRQQPADDWVRRDDPGLRLRRRARDLTTRATTAPAPSSLPV
jgi:hypothetical protein